MQLFRFHSREVTSGFLVLCLFFRQKPGEGNNVGVDLLRASAGALAVGISVSSHVELTGSISVRG